MAALRPLLSTLVLFAGLTALPVPATAAETFHTCTGYITSLPTTITTQGTWCMNRHLETAITSGNAIAIATNNVTIDCNDFKLGGLAAGTATQATGIFGLDRLNATVRRCNVRGFKVGIELPGSGGGHVVEDNRLDGNTVVGLRVDGDGSEVRRNKVLDTGGSTGELGYAYAIQAILSVDVIDNSVTGVLPTANGSGNAHAYGIYTYANTSGRIRNNGVRGLVASGAGKTWGIHNDASGRVSVAGNDVLGPGDIGIGCFDAKGAAKDNIISGFAAPLSACRDGGDNTIVP